MNGYSLLMLAGGLAFFLYGMHTLSMGLEKLAGSRLERALQRMTSGSVKGVLFGTLITAAVQSSSAVTVMLVGLVNAGMVTAKQSVGIVMGSNIGTTLTAWIFSLVGLDGDVWWLSWLKPENMSPLFAVIGTGLLVLSSRPGRKDSGTVLVSFAVLLYGMRQMCDAVSPMADTAQFEAMLGAFDSPAVCLLVGVVFTAVIQSSSASVGVLETLALTGGVSFNMAIPMVMGQNIGTCVTAILSAVGTSRSAKKVALIHLLLNVIGTAVLLGAFYLSDAVWHYPFKMQAATAFDIALIHSAFNIVSTVILLPFADGLEKLADLLLPEQAPKQRPRAGKNGGLSAPGGRARS